MNNLAENQEIQNAVKELMRLEEEPRGPRSLERIRKIFGVFYGAENQGAIHTIVEAHFPTIANHVCPPL